MICTFADGSIIPKVAPAVDGSPRTLILVDVVPSMGVGVETAVGGWAVWVGGGGVVGGRVDVIIKIVGVAESDAMLSPQPDANIDNTIMKKNFLCTR